MDIFSDIGIFLVIWVILAMIPLGFYLGGYKKRKKAAKNLETHKLQFRGQIVNKHHYTEVIPGDDESPDTEVHYVKYTVQFWHNGKIYLAIKDYKYNKYDDELTGVTVGVNPINHNDVIIVDIEKRIAKGNKILNVICSIMNIFMIIVTVATILICLVFI